MESVRNTKKEKVPKAGQATQGVDVAQILNNARPSIVDVNNTIGQIKRNLLACVQYLVEGSDFLDEDLSRHLDDASEYLTQELAAGGGVS